MMYNFSYSQSTTLQSCERKYFFKYVISQPVDVDYVKRDYFSVGNAFHKIMEETKHESSKYSLDLCKQSCALYPILKDDDVAIINAMSRRYYELHHALGLKCIATETRYEPSGLTLIIDAIMQDNEGNWYICDLKTASAFDANKHATLARDPQLNLYSAYRKLVVNDLKLDEEKYKGVLLREVSKPRLKRKANEDFESYSSRCFDSSRARQCFIAKENLEERYSFNEFSKYFNRSRLIFKEYETTKKTTTRCNFQNCIQYNSPCEYFSQCHGKLFTKAFEDYKPITNDDISIGNMPSTTKIDDNLDMFL